MISIGACQILRKNRMLKLAASYVGAVVGAGFASGQEHVHFFYKMPLQSGRGIPFAGPGILLAGGLFVLFGAALGGLAFEYQTFSSEEFLRQFVPWPLCTIYDSLMTLFIFWSLSIMLAGSGTLFEQSIGLSSRAGILITAIFTIFATAAGIDGLLVVNLIMSPFMVIMPILVAIISMWKRARGFLLPICMPNFKNVLVSVLIPSWPLSALLYVSYNILLAVGVFASIGRDIPDSGTAQRGGILGGIALMFFLVAIQIVLVIYGASIAGDELPMLRAASHHGLLIARCYSLALWFAMATTSVCSAFALSQRLSKHFIMSKFSVIAVITIVAGFPAQLGFAKLVATVYPIVGYMGLPVLAIILFQFLKMQIGFR